MGVDRTEDGVVDAAVGNGLEGCGREEEFGGAVVRGRCGCC